MKIGFYPYWSPVQQQGGGRGGRHPFMAFPHPGCVQAFRENSLCLLPHKHALDEGQRKNNGTISSYNSAKSLPDVGFTKVIMDCGIISKDFFIAMAWGQGNKPSRAEEDSLYLRLFVLAVNTEQNLTYQSLPSKGSSKSLLTAPKENQLLLEMKRLKLNLPLPKAHCVTLWREKAGPMSGEIRVPIKAAPEERSQDFISKAPCETLRQDYRDLHLKT